MNGEPTADVVAGLYFYPVKSLRGISLKEAELTRWGIRRDRMWMLAREGGRFITQREEHRLALLDVTESDEGYRITAPDGSFTTLPSSVDVASRERVSVWKDDFPAAVGPEDAARFFSTYLGYSCKPVFMPEKAGRKAREFAPAGTPLSFADAYPGLLTTVSSLDDLNQRTSVAIVMNRFRPNIVTSAPSPFAEDTWSRIRIGEAEIVCVKPCARCVLTTVDPDSGHSGKEPLKTLATYRRLNNDVYFGQNFVVSKSGTIRVGDAIQVLEFMDPVIPHGVQDPVQ